MRSTLLIVLVSLSQVGCYTVVRQSSEYYSEFSSGTYEEDRPDSTGADDLAETGDVYNYYYDTPSPYPYFYNTPGAYPYYDPWLYPFRPYGYGPFAAAIVLDPWYYDYYYWGGCYYPGSYPHYKHYYPGGTVENRFERPFGLRNTAIVSSGSAQPTTRSAQWNGQNTARKFRLRNTGSAFRTPKSGSIPRFKSANSARSFNAIRSNSGSPVNRPSVKSSSTSRTTKSTGGRQFRNKDQ